MRITDLIEVSLARGVICMQEQPIVIVVSIRNIDSDEVIQHANYGSRRLCPAWLDLDPPRYKIASQKPSELGEHIGPQYVLV